MKENGLYFKYNVMQRRHPGYGNTENLETQSRDVAGIYSGNYHVFLCSIIVALKCFTRRNATVILTS